MCTGRIDPGFILRAFANGTDGVYIGGCWPGECHYPTEGNYHALSMVLLTQKMLKHIGVHPGRLMVEWVSAAEGIRFAEVMNDVVKRVKELGPIGRAEGIDENRLKLKLEAIRNLLPYIKLVEQERLGGHFHSEEEIKKFYGSEEMDRLFRELIVDPLVMSEIMMLLREKPLTVGEISAGLGLGSSEASRYLNRSSRQGWVRFDQRQKRFVSVRSQGVGTRSVERRG